MGLIQLHSGAVNGSCSDEVHCLDNMVKDKSYRKYQQTPLSIDGKVLNANKKKSLFTVQQKKFSTRWRQIAFDLLFYGFIRISFVYPTTSSLYNEISSLGINNLC